MKTICLNDALINDNIALNRTIKVLNAVFPDKSSFEL